MKKLLLMLVAALMSCTVAHSAIGPGSKTNRLYLQYTSDSDANWLELAADSALNQLRVFSGKAGASKPARPLVLSAGNAPSNMLVVSTNGRVGIRTLYPEYPFEVSGTMAVSNIVLRPGGALACFSGGVIQVDTSSFSVSLISDLQMTGKEEGVGKVWTCTNDITGQGKWETPSGGSGTAQTNNLYVGTTNEGLVPITITPRADQTSATLVVYDTSGNIVFAISNSSVVISGTNAGRIDLIATNKINFTRITVPEDQAADYTLTTPAKSGTIAVTSDLGSSGGSNTATMIVTNTYRMSCTNIVVDDVTTIDLDLATWNVFKIWLMTNANLRFINQYYAATNFGIVNALVYFQQDPFGGWAVNYSVLNGNFQTNASLQPTTNAGALDLLEVKSGFFTTNIMAYWPQNFQPQFGYTNSLYYGAAPPPGPPEDGQITGIEIDPSGWYANVTVEGMTNGGTFDWGWVSGTEYDTSNVFLTTNIVFTVTRMGYDGTGEPTTITENIAGVKAVRRPYPDHASLWMDTNDTSLTFRVALSDWICSRDSNITATVASGWYDDDTTTSIATNGLAVTNSSDVPYAKVVANWAWPPHETYVTSTITNRAFAFHRSARNGQPVRTVKFWSRQGTASNTPVVVSNLTINTDLSDAVPVQEYVATLDISGFSDGGFTNYFAAYPWVGDESSVYSSESYIWHDYRGGPAICVKNATNGYGATWAYVDDTVSGAPGVVFTNAGDFNTSSPFTNIHFAMIAIAQTNNTVWGHNDYGNGTIYLASNQNHKIGTVSLNTYSEPLTWVTITKLPANNIEHTFVHTNQNTSMPKLTKWKFYEVTMNHTNNSIPLFNNPGRLWFDKVYRDNNNNSAGYWAFGGTNIYLTRSTVGTIKPEYAPQTTNANDRWFIRGNTFTNYADLRGYLIAGNRFDPVESLKVSLNNEKNLISFDPFIHAFNLVLKMNVDLANPPVTYARNTNLYIGGACINNVFENVEGPGPNNLVGAGIENTATNGVTNLMFWYNTFVGQRWNDQYNDSGTENSYSVLGTWLANVSDDYNTKQDTEPVESGIRTNRFPVGYMVGGRYNAFGEMVSGNFEPESPSGGGMIGFNGVGTRWFDTNRPADLWQWITNKAPVTTADVGDGGGFYVPTSNSVLQGIVAVKYLPYDLLGSNRVVNGAPGAYEYQAP